jgi:hypothetical protein
MSSTQRATEPDTTRVDDELLTMQEVADVVRVPVATLRYWRHLAPGRAASASAAASVTGAGRYSPGSTTRPMVIPRASSDIMPLAEVAPVSDRLDGGPDQLSRSIGAAAVELMRRGEDGQR